MMNLRASFLAGTAVLAMTLPAQAQFEQMTLQMAHDFTASSIWYEVGERFASKSPRPRTAR